MRPTAPRRKRWSIQMEGYGGPAQPSPTIGQCLNGGLGWLEVECNRCKTRASIPLTRIRRPSGYAAVETGSGAEMPVLPEGAVTLHAAREMAPDIARRGDGFFRTDNLVRVAADLTPRYLRAAL